MKPHKYAESIKEICINKHLTIENILKELKKTSPWVWLATIYRTVDFLVNKWEMRKIDNIDKTSYYETIINPHIHFIDEDTKEIIDIPLDSVNINDDLFSKISDIRVIWKIKK